MRRRIILAIPIIVCLLAAVILVPRLFAGRVGGNGGGSDGSGPAPATAAASEPATAPGPEATSAQRWQDLAGALQAGQQRAGDEVRRYETPMTQVVAQVNSRHDPDFFSPSEADYVWRQMTKDFPLPLPPSRSWPREAPAWMRYEDGGLFQEGLQESAGADFWYCAWLDTAMAYDRKPIPGLTRERITQMLAADAEAPHHWAHEQAEEQRERARELAHGDATDWLGEYNLLHCDVVLAWPDLPDEVPLRPPGG